MKKLLSKVTIAAVMSTSFISTFHILPIQQADAKATYPEYKYIKTFYPDVTYYQGNGPISSTNTTTVYNSKKQQVSLLMTSKGIMNLDEKPMKSMTILLENGKKVYVKNGKLYANTKKTTLLNSKIKTKKVLSYDMRKATDKSMRGYAYEFFEATVRKGKIVDKTLKLHVWEYGTVIHPG